MEGIYKGNTPLAEVVFTRCQPGERCFDSLIMTRAREEGRTAGNVTYGLW